MIIDFHSAIYIKNLWVHFVISVATLFNLMLIKSQINCWMTAAPSNAFFALAFLPFLWSTMSLSRNNAVACQLVKSRELPTIVHWFIQCLRSCNFTWYFFHTELHFLMCKQRFGYVNKGGGLICSFYTVTWNGKCQ